mmetsp:Transcript_50580/g.120643  ORF Transcript_50580/g.120643 Transcript_50580/m.120643 type:complete len:242 (-) Transcript_50580:358-1083(-)
MDLAAHARSRGAIEAVPLGGEPGRHALLALELRRLPLRDGDASRHPDGGELDPLGTTKLIRELLKLRLGVCAGPNLVDLDGLQGPLLRPDEGRRGDAVVEGHADHVVRDVAGVLQAELPGGVLVVLIRLVEHIFQLLVVAFGELVHQVVEDVAGPVLVHDDVPPNQADAGLLHAQLVVLSRAIQDEQMERLQWVELRHGIHYDFQEGALLRHELLSTDARSRAAPDLDLLNQLELLRALLT